MSKVGVLFVCLGNICRSPLADGVFRDLVETAGLGEHFLVDSCGTGGWHVGEPPDRRMIDTAKRHGVDLRSLRARQFDSSDLNRFDEVLAMDRSNLSFIERHQRGGERARVSLFLLEAAGLSHDEVPDPYYGAGDGFELCWQLVHTASKALLARIRQERGF